MLTELNSLVEAGVNTPNMNSEGGASSLGHESKQLGNLVLREISLHHSYGLKIAGGCGAPSL